MRNILTILIAALFIIFPAEALGLKLPSQFKGPKEASESPVKISWFLSHESLQKGDEIWVAARFMMEDEWHIYGEKEPIGTPTKLEVVPEESDFTVLDSALSEASRHELKIGDVTQDTWFLGSGSLAGLRLKHNGSDQFRLKVRAVYQPCTMTTCSLIQKEEKSFTIASGVSTPATSLDSEVLKSLTQWFSRKEEQPSGVSSNVLSGALLFALLQAFLWGVLASLTPCVYPMIPITVSLFSSEKEDQGKALRFVRALAYVLGIVLSYALLGLIAAKTGRDLGSFLAIRWVSVLLSLLMVAMATSLFGWWEMDLPASLKQKLGTYEGSGPVGLFLMGSAMGFVAAPCVGPFAAAIIVWIVANPQDLMSGFLMMASFGMGLGVLFLMLALFSQNILPRSGGWMVELKQVMGWLLVGVAWHFQTTFYSEAVVTSGWGVWMSLLGVLLGAFTPLEGKPSLGSRLLKGIGVLCLVQGLIWFSGFQPGGSAQTVAMPQKSSHHDSAKKALAAGKAGHKPVMLYFSAKWCIPCRQIKAEILPDPEIQAALAGFDWAIADSTEADSENARLKSEVYQSPAMPFFAFHDASGKRLKHLEIEGKITKAELLEALNQVK